MDPYQSSVMNAVGYPGTQQSVTGQSPYGPYKSGYLGASTPSSQSVQPSGVGLLQNYDPTAFLKALIPPQGHAAAYDTGAASVRAMQQAQGQVDPFYNQQINAFNTNMAAQRQQAQQEQELANSNIQSSLQNTLQGNEITQGRVGEDTSTALNNLANAQQNYKSTEGMQFDQAQRALGTQLGQAGTAESGGGQQQVATAQKQEQLGQQAQGQQYQVQRAGQQLFANRSFEDIARSSGVAKQQAGLQTQGAQLNLNKELTSIAQYENQYGTQLEQGKKQAEMAQSAANYTNNLRNFYSSLGNMSTADLQATYQKYGAG